MRSTALGTAWLLWRRLRWSALLVLLFGSCLALYTHLSLPGPATTRLSIFLTSMPLMFGLLYLMAAFAYPDADIMAPHSGFPRHMLTLPGRWIGVMGSPRHTAPHVDALRRLGVLERVISRVHRPIGLNIGSRTPAEIAIATLAGLIADRNRRPGGFVF